MKIVLIPFFILLICISLFWSFEALANDNSFIPGLSVKNMYNSNYFFDRDGDELESYCLSVSPFATLDYKPEPFSINGRIQFDVLRYLDETQLNSENQWYLINLGYNINNRCTLSSNLSYVNDSSIAVIGDTTSENSLRELTLASRRDLFRGGVDFRYIISRLSNIGFAYRFTKIDYTNDLLISYQDHTIDIFYKRYFNDRIDSISIRPSFYHRSYENNTEDDIGLWLDWEHLFTRRYSLDVSLGIRRRIKNSKEGTDNEEELYGDIKIGLVKSGPTYELKTGYYYGTEYSDFGGTVRIHGIYCHLKKTLTKDMGLKVLSGCYWPTDRDFDFESDHVDYPKYSSYYGIEPALFYNLSKRFKLELAGDYTLYYEAERKRARIWISLTYAVPKRW